MRRLIAITLLMVGVLTAMGQLYKLDPVLADSVQLYEIKPGTEKQQEILGSRAIKLPAGETVMVERKLEDYSGWGVINVAGTKYAVADGDIVLSDENPEGTEDLFGDTRSNVRHTAIGKFFYSSTPYWIIGILFVISIVFMIYACRSWEVRKWALPIATISLLLASGLEIWAFALLRMDAFWWCDSHRYGFWETFVRVIPFVVSAFFQLFSIKLYMRMLADDDDNDLSVKPMLVSFVISVPVALVATAIGAMGGLRSTGLALLTVGSFLLVLFIGSFKSWRRNVREIGVGAGTAFTLFAVVWCAGAAIAIVGLVVALIKVFVQVMIVGAVFGVLGGKYAKEIPVERKPKQVYSDCIGRTYSSAAERDRANKEWRDMINSYK